MLGPRTSAPGQSSGGVDDSRPHFGVDHDFPEPLLNAARPFLTFDGTMLRHIDPALVADKEDWEVILALYQLGYDGLITLDAAMLQLTKEIAVVHQTRSTLVVIEAAGDNPLRAMGQLMVQAPHIAGAFDRGRPQIFRIPAPRAIRPSSAWDRLGELASERGEAIEAVFRADSLSDGELETPGAPQGRRR